MEKEKIWGVYYPFSSQEIEDLDEFDTFRNIYNLSERVLNVFNKTSDKMKIMLPDLVELQYALEYLIYSTRKFGVVFDKEPSSLEHIERTESFNSWFRFWENHFNSMTEEEIDDFRNAKYMGINVSKFLPSDSWNQSIKLNR